MDVKAVTYTRGANGHGIYLDARIASARSKSLAWVNFILVLEPATSNGR